MGHQTGAVTATKLNVREYPSISSAKIGSLSRGKQVDILAVEQQWYKIKSDDLNGFVYGDFITLVDKQPASPYLMEMDSLQTVPLTESMPIQITGVFSATEKKVAKAWNDFGGLITALSYIVDIDPGCAVAVICVESSGKGFSADNRMIIRFENHKFWTFWGKQHPDQFRRYFKYRKGKAWLGHEFRTSVDENWKTFHGKQSREWDVFNFAKSLDESAAMQSISMGLPQIMGFNHAAIGYGTSGQMFGCFQSDIRYHILGLFDFLRGAGTTSPMLQALQLRQYDQFASRYNGSGQAAQYGNLIEEHFETFKNLTSRQA